MICVHCIMHGSLEDYLPDVCQGNQIQAEFESRPSVDDILVRFNIDRGILQFVLADGRYIELQDWHQPVDAESFQFWPRISGG